MSLFCHGTDKQPNYINDSKFENPVRLHLVCKKSQFFNDDLKLTSKTLSKMSCKESQEPEIIRENESYCSKGLGADGRSNTNKKITLVKGRAHSRNQNRSGRIDSIIYIFNLI